ncbi:MAG: type VI secretion system tip protein VgrG [Bryobacteraceae bacterium]|nr:type VI secretion system tip protein VgrG [Bryobacteraceae bacterium]
MAGGQFTQDNRFLSLTTPLGKDVLLLNSFMVSERVSAPYRIELDVLYKGTVDPNKLLGQPVNVTARYGDAGALESKGRNFDGIVSEIGIGGETERFRRFRLVVVPRLWLTTLSQNFRSFESETTPDIIKKVLAPYAMQTRFELTGDYAKWDFCFQYRESDFNFISRMMEAEGIFYFFEHSANNHTMVFGDTPSSFKVCPGQSSVNFGPDIGAGGEDFVTDWELSAGLRSGSYRLWDWHFERPSGPYGPATNTVEPVAGNAAYKVSDYPGRFTQQFNKIDAYSDASSEGTKLTKIRMEEIETLNPFYRGSSFVRAFSSGQRFSLVGGDRPGEYALTHIEHMGAQYPPYLSGMEQSVLYTNHFDCIPFGEVFRPARQAERAVVYGPQTALVIEGPDKYARMRVKFHWGEQTASGWLRVAQRWAGPQWGTIHLPRVNHEVIVDFIDGDPDQPIIVGSVYNKQNMPPYPLPDKYTQSGIKTRSMSPDGSTQGGSDEFNELRFDDKQGEEEIYFHAQKDFNRVVENDDDLKVGNDQTIEIKNNRTETVKDGNEKVTIVLGNREVFVDNGNDKHQVKMGNREAIIDMGNESLTVKMGNHTQKIDLGKSETEAMQSITLKVGQNSIKVDQMGITLDGLMIDIKGQIMIKSKAPIQQMNGDAMIMIKGGITMIN